MTANRAGASANQAILTATVDGAIVWGIEGTDRPYTLCCGTCGATAGWRLRVRRDYDADGERAWAVCPIGHEVTDPLIYPGMVRTLLNWLRQPAAERPPLSIALADWEPHRAQLVTDEDAVTHPVVVWEPLSAGPERYWRGRYPDVLAAATLPPPGCDVNPQETHGATSSRAEPADQRPEPGVVPARRPVDHPNHPSRHPEGNGPAAQLVREPN